MNLKAIGIAATIIAVPLCIGIFYSWLQYPEDFANRKDWQLCDLKLSARPDKVSTRFSLWLFVRLTQIFVLVAAIFLVLGGIYE